MSDSLKPLIDRGLVVIAEIAKLQKELKGIEAKIKDGAKSRSDEHLPLKDDAREGRQFLARGSKLIVPVVFTADKLVGTFKKDSKEHDRIIAVCADLPPNTGRFSDFFRPWNGFENRFKDGQDFRTKADELLRDAAPAFISACLARDKDDLPKSDIKIEWSQAAADQKLNELATQEAA